MRQANRPIHFQGLKFGVGPTNSPAFGTAPNTLFSMKMWNCRLRETALVETGRNTPNGTLQLG